MPEAELTKRGWDTAIQFGAVGVIAFFAVVGLCVAIVWYVRRSEKNCDERHAALTAVIERKDAVIEKKDAKLETVYEGICVSSGQAMSKLTIAVDRLTERLERK